MSFPTATKMFQFAAFASAPYVFRYGYRLKRWVSPFGNPRIKAYSQLPKAYRRVSRPSSPLHAKASTKCPSHARERIIRARGSPSRDANASSRTTGSLGICFPHFTDRSMQGDLPQTRIVSQLPRETHSALQTQTTGEPENSSQCPSIRDQNHKTNNFPSRSLPQTR